MPIRAEKRWASLYARFAKSDVGTAAIEFAIIAAVLISLTVGALELFVSMQAQAYLQTSAEAGGRLILTGNVQTKSLTQAQFKTAVCNTIPALLNCNNLMVDVQVATSFSSATVTAPTITYDASGNVNNTWAFNPGGPGNIVVLRLLYQWPMIKAIDFKVSNQSNGTMLLMATSVFKNEAYQ